MKKINIGCGKDIRKNWDNLDLHGRNGANIIWDLNNLPLPIKDNVYDYVYCSHVLEDFIDPLPIMEEFVRIVKPKGIIELRVPYETCNWHSIYHKKPFNLYTFKSFIRKGENYNHKANNLEIKELKFYTFKTQNKLANVFRGFVTLFYNLFPICLVENTFIKYLFPFANIKVIYKKVE